LCMLEEEDRIKQEREISHRFYRSQLRDYIQLQKQNSDATQSYSYFPVVFRDENEMSIVREALLEHNIAARQYFKPSLDTLPFVEHREVMKNSRDISSRILVIPMHSDVEPIVSEIIINTIKEIES